MKRQYLLPLLTSLACVGCAKEKPEPDAVVAKRKYTVDFTYNGTLKNNRAIQFINNSINGTSYSWNFGDNTPVSVAKQPTHSFSSEGTYPVSLTVTGSNGPVTTTKQLTVAPNDTAILVQSLVGKYRFTKLTSTCFSNTGGNNTSSCGKLTEPCDIVTTVSRVGQDVSMSLFGTLPLSYIGTNYVFTNGDPSDLSQASFKKGTDSLVYVRATSSLGGGHSQVYYGQKIP